MRWLAFWLATPMALLALRLLKSTADVHACARTGRVTRLRALLAKDPRLQRKPNSRGELPVHQAARFGQVEAVRLLLDAGSDVNATTPLGITPLHFAAGFGAVDVVELLLARGAEADRRERSMGMTPIMCAKAGRHPSVVALLKAAGADDTAALPAEARA